MIVDNHSKAIVVYRGFPERIASFSELPPVIRFNIKGYLKRNLGSLSDSVMFSHGQILDLKAYFRKDAITYKYYKIIPKYDLYFKLIDSSIGIKSYNLKLDLDEHGQILYSNWPQKGYDDKTEFKTNEVIIKAALKAAELKFYCKNEYLIDFKYNRNLDKLCWLFMFEDIRYRDPDRKKYHVIEVDWKSGEVVNEYRAEHF